MALSTVAYDRFIDLLDADEYEFFEDIEDAPTDDEILMPDGDDQLVAVTNGFGIMAPKLVREELERRVEAKQPPRIRIVPFSRELRRGMKGLDVAALQRALRHANRRHDGSMPKRSGNFGPFTEKALREFQQRYKKRGHPNFDVDGQFGRESLRALAPHFDAYGISMIQRQKELIEKEKEEHRTKRVPLVIESAAIFGYGHRPLIHYSQSPSRMYGVRNGILPPAVPFYEDCLAAGTMIATSRGDVPVEDIREGDLVLTRSGAHLVERAWKVRDGAEVVRVEMDNGRALVGTPEHKVWTLNRGWASLATLREADMLIGWVESNGDASRVTRTTAIPTRRRPPSGSISSARRGFFTERSGRTPTGRSRRASTSTTETAIPGTTRSRTLSWWSEGRIARRRRECAAFAATSAPGAGRRSSAGIRPATVLAGVALVAPGRPGGARDETRWSDRALSAATCSLRTGTGRGRTARIAVTRPLGPARAAGRSSVYDLTVSAAREFFANGVLVHNCSSYSKWTYYVAKRRAAPNLPDPDGLGWAPYGYTGTLSKNGKRATSKVRGALGFYGGGTFSHVVISIGTGTRIISHGSEEGPNLVSTPYYRSDFAEWRVYPGVHY